MTTVEAHSAGNHADAAAEAIRALNHALKHRSDFTVGDTYRIIAALADTFYRSGEALAQVHAILALRASDPDALTADDGSNPLDALRTASDALASGQTHLLAADQATRDAQNAIAKIADRHLVDEQ